MKRSIIFISLSVCLAVGIPYIYRQQLIRKYFLLNREIWKLEDEIVSHSSFTITDIPKDILDKGIVEKYFLTDSKSQMWMFKLEPLKLSSFFTRQISRFSRFCGFGTPMLTTLNLPINNKFYLGTIQKLVAKSFDIDSLDKLSKLDEDQINVILTYEVCSYLFDNTPQYLLSNEGVLYAIDLLEGIDFSYVLSSADIEDISEILQGDVFDFFNLNQLKRNIDINKKEFNFCVSAKDWKDFYRNKNILIFHTHQHCITNGITPDINEVSKLISFITHLSDKDFLTLIKIPELDGNKPYEKYLQSVITRKRNLKKHFESLYAALDKNFKDRGRQDFNKRYSMKELRSKMDRLKSRLKILLLEREYIDKSKEKQKMLNVVSCPEAWWFVNGYCDGIFTYNETIQMLNKLSAVSENRYENEAINYYIKKLRGYGNTARKYLTQEDRILYRIEE